MALFWNPSDKGANTALTNDDKTLARASGSGWTSARAAGAGRTEGKWYIEFNTDAATNFSFGIAADDASVLDTYVGATADSLGVVSTGGFWVSGSDPDDTPAVGVGWWCLAVDLDALTITLYDSTGAQHGSSATIPAGKTWLPAGSSNVTWAHVEINDSAPLNTVPPPGHNPWSGNPYHVAGTVKQDGSNVSREIRVIDAANGELLATADSIGGSFDIGLLSADPVFVQAIPAEGYRPLIKGPLTPVEIA